MFSFKGCLGGQVTHRSNVYVRDFVKVIANKLT